MMTFSRIVFLVLCILIGRSLAQAEPITFTFHSATLAGVPITQATGEWKQLPPLRIKLLPNGMVDSNDPDATGILWAAMVAPFSREQEFKIAVSGRICIGTSCANITLDGVLATSAQGLRWATSPLNSTYKTDDGLSITLSPITNQPGGDVRNWTSTIDLAIKGDLVPLTPTPEPLTLFTLGAGLAGLAGLAKRRKK